MKTLSFFYVLAMICAFPAQGQPFSSVTLGTVQNHDVVTFTVPSESNTMYYRVEASNDNINYEIIGTVRSTGNSVLAKNYHYAVNDGAYKYYRVGKVGMNARLQYSSVIAVQNETLPGAPGINTHTTITEPAIVKNNDK